MPVIIPNLSKDTSGKGNYYQEVPPPNFGAISTDVERGCQ
jgi:hypothetical protein